MLSLGCSHTVNSIAVRSRPCSGAYSARHGGSGTFGSGIICFWRSVLLLVLVLIIIIIIIIIVITYMQGIYSSILEKNKSVRYTVSQLFCIHNSCYT